MGKSFKKIDKKKPVVNMGEIKRNLIIRDTGLDARFTTKAAKSKKAYNRSEGKKVIW
jgi:hypothetical protein